jgi:hypothetical protein
MIIWSGLGILTAVIALLGFAGGGALIKVLPQPYAIPAGLLIAAAVNFAFASWASDPSKGREMIDAKTGQRIILLRRHSLFFIPVRYWTYIIAVAALLLLAAGLSKAPGA